MQVCVVACSYSRACVCLRVYVRAQIYMWVPAQRTFDISSFCSWCCISRHTAREAGHRAVFAALETSTAEAFLSPLFHLPPCFGAGPVVPRHQCVAIAPAIRRARLCAGRARDAGAHTHPCNMVQSERTTFRQGVRKAKCLVHLHLCLGMAV